MYDLPAMINKTIDTTKEEKIFYIGHSMGTTTVMAMANYYPEMSEKIILASLLAPVAFVEHMRSPIGLIAPFVNIIEVKPSRTTRPLTTLSMCILGVAFRMSLYF